MNELINDLADPEEKWRLYIKQTKNWRNTSMTRPKLYNTIAKAWYRFFFILWILINCIIPLVAEMY